MKNALVESSGRDLQALGTVAIPELAVGLRHASQKVRNAAAMVLGSMGDSAAAALIGASRDPDDQVRLSALYGLWRLGPVVEHRLIEMQLDPSEPVRKLAIGVLADPDFEHDPSIQ